MISTIPFTLVLAALTSLAFAEPPSAVQHVTEQYRSVEARLKDCDRVTGSQTDRWSETMITGYYPSGQRVPIKITEKSAGEHGQSWHEYTLDSKGMPIFVFSRNVTTPASGRAFATESRLYFVDGECVRRSQKRKEFPSTQDQYDLSDVKNQDVPAEEFGRFEDYADIAEAVERRQQKLARFRSDEIEDGMGAAAPGFRVIEGTSSPEAVYAIAWGIKGNQPVDWSAYIAEDGTAMAQPSRSENYLVDLSSGAILKTVHGNHFGDKATYNHEAVKTTWAPGGQMVVYQQDWKWHTAFADLYMIGEEEAGYVDGPVRLGQLALQSAIQVYGEHDPSIADRIKSGEYQLRIADVSFRDGKLKFTLAGEVPKSPDTPDFSAMVTVALPDSGRYLDTVHVEEFSPMLGRRPSQ